MTKDYNYFPDKNDVTINQLVYWFLVNFPTLASDMRDCSHAVKTDEPNPYHIEGDIFCHTMLVCQRAEIDDVSKVNKICALLHDIGKPEAREVIPFEKKKPVHTESNEIRNDGKNNGKDSGLNRIVPPSGKKVHQRGHEGLSFYKAIEIVNALEKEGVLNLEEKKEILTIISLHGTLFDSIDTDGNMRNKNKVFAKFFRAEKIKMLQFKNDIGDYTLLKKKIKEFFKDEINLFNNFVTQVLCDSTGRFFTSKDGRKNNAFKLGKEIFTEDQFIDYIVERIEEYQEKPKSESYPKITVLIGPPASGKTHWRDENITNEVVISRDDELMNYAKDNAIEGNYSDVWKYLEENDRQKEVDKMVQDKFKDAMKFRKDIVIDMTNMSRKSRRKWFNTVPKEYVKKSVIFATGYKEVYARNEKRFQETGKNIPNFVINNMMKGFMVPTYDECNEVEWIF